MIMNCGRYAFNNGGFHRIFFCFQNFYLLSIFLKQQFFHEIDLIFVLYFQQEKTQPWHRGAARWCQDLRSPVLGIGKKHKCHNNNV